MSSIPIKSVKIASSSVGAALAPPSGEVAEVREAARIPEPWTLSSARALLVATLIGAPWAYAAMVAWAWVALGLVASLALFLWAVGSVRQGVLRFVWSPLYVPIALFFLLGVVQYAARLTLDRSETRQALVLLAADLVLFFLALQLFAGASRRTWRTFGRTVMIFAGALGLFTILQFASGARIYGRLDMRTTFFGPYDNPDHFAGLMEMLLPVAVFYVVVAARAARPPSAAALVALVLAVAVALASLLLTGSRGGLLALASEVVAACWILRRRQPAAGASVAATGAVSHSRAGGNPHKPRTLGNRSALLATLAATVLAAALLFSWVNTGRASKRLALLLDVRSPNWVDKSRLVWTLDSLRILRAHPLLGVGLGNFGTAYPAYQSLPSDLWIDHAHDDYAEALAETGLAGALLMASALALFWRLGRGWRVAPGEGAGWIRLGAALGCCGLLAHSFFDFNLHVPANAAWFAVLAGLASSPILHLTNL